VLQDEFGERTKATADVENQPDLWVGIADGVQHDVETLRAVGDVGILLSFPQADDFCDWFW
jgi:hypothetical protein